MLIIFVIHRISMVSWNELKTEISKELRNGWFILYLFSVLVFFVAFKLIDSKTFRIISLVLLILFLLRYSFKTKFEDNFQKYVMRILSVLILFLGISYVAISVGEAIIATIMLALVTATIPLSIAGGSIHALLYSKSLKEIIFFYLLLVAATIIFFGFGFALLSNSEGNELRWTKDNTSVSNIDNGIFNPFNYFSALVFYTNTFDDLTPFGRSKILVLIELISSFIIHSIILASVLDSDFIKKRSCGGAAKN